jgi:hypothetical protein
MAKLLFTRNHRWIDLELGTSGITYLFFHEINPIQIKFYPPLIKQRNHEGILVIKDHEQLNKRYFKMFDGNIIDVNYNPTVNKDLIWLYRLANPKVNEDEMMDFETYMAWNHSLEN